MTDTLADRAMKYYNFFSKYNTWREMASMGLYKLTIIEDKQAVIFGLVEAAYDAGHRASQLKKGQRDENY